MAWWIIKNTKEKTNIDKRPIIVQNTGASHIDI